MKSLMQKVHACIACNNDQVDAIKMLALVGAAWKLNANAMTALYNMGSANQYDQFIGVFNEMKGSRPNLFKNFTISITQELLSACLLTVNGQDDLPMLGAILRNAFSMCANRNKQMVSMDSDNGTRLFTHLLGNCPGQTICDPVAGFCLRTSHFKENDLLLREFNPSMYGVVNLCLFLEDSTANYQLASSMFDPCFEGNSADIVILSPPFGVRNALEKAESFKFLLKALLTQGPLPATAGESLWVQLALYYLKKPGKAHILLPAGWFFRGGYDARLRNYLLDRELIESIVALPSGFLEGTKISPYLLTLNTNKVFGTPIHFVDASTLGQKKHREFVLSDADCILIRDLANGVYPDDPRFAFVFTPAIRCAKDSQGKNDDLSIALYVKPQKTEQQTSLKKEMNKLNAMQERFMASQEELNKLLSLYGKS